MKELIIILMKDYQRIIIIILRFVIQQSYILNGLLMNELHNLKSFKT